MRYINNKAIYILIIALFISTAFFNISIYSEELYSTNIIPEMTTNNLPSGVASASSQYGDMAPYRAFDKLNIDYLYDSWQSDGLSMPQWLEYDFGENNGKKVQKYLIKCHNSLSADSTSAPKDFILQGSNDDTNWVNLDERTEQTNWTLGEMREYTFLNSNVYRYYRLYITTTNGSQYAVIGELEMMEVVAPVITPPTNLTATSYYSKVDLSWSGVEGATSYNVKRATTAGGTYTNIANNIIGLTYSDTTVNNYMTYYYVVTANDDINESENSNEISIQAGSGSGTSEDPYVIYSTIDLKNINNNLSGYYRLANDIDLNNEAWTPIGTLANAFSGGFDGNGYKISNVNIAKIGIDYVGFFSFTYNATIKNIELNNINVEGKDYVGALLGYGAGVNTIDNCKVTGTSTVKGSLYVGGLIGKVIDGNVNRSMSIANITGSGYTGGLIGCLVEANVTNSYASGGIVAGNYTGGLIGYIPASTTVTGQKIENCYALGRITVYTTNNYIGGLIGFIYTRNTANIVTVKNCYSATVLPMAAYRGGLIGVINNSSITASYYDGVASGFIPQNYVIDFSRLTTSMKRQATYIGWDFTNVWAIQEDNSYPYIMGLDTPTGVTEGLPTGDIGTGRGTVDDPYLINNKEQLQNVKYEPTAYYKLMNDIDLLNQQWAPIGYANYSFSGGFDGNGYKISNVNIAKSGIDYIGFFGSTNNATINNIELNNINVEGKDYVGALLGYGAGVNTIDNCKVTGTSTVKGSLYVGGLIGKVIDGNVNRSMSIANITGSGYTGGLIGCLVEANVTNSYASGGIVAGNYTGGLIGYIPASTTVTGQKIENCYALGRITVYPTNNYIGGLIGFIYTRKTANIVTVKNCYSATVLPVAAYRGGLIGAAYNAIIVSSYFDSTITGFTIPTTQARTTQQLKTQATFVDWDFLDIWDIEEGITYPYLYSVAVPVNIHATNISHNEIDIAWDNILEADEYKVEINGQIVETTTVASFIHNNLIPGTIYYYRVRAIERSLIGDWSAKKAIITLLELPTNIALSTSETSITVSWSPVDGATYYEIYVDGEIINNSESTTYVHNITSPNTQHVYRVRAKNTITQSNWSDIFTDINWSNDGTAISVTTNKWIFDTDVVKETEIVIKAKDVNDLYTVHFELEYDTQQLALVEDSLLNLAWGNNENMYYRIYSDSNTGKIKVILSQTGILQGLTGQYDIVSLKAILSSASSSIVKLSKIVLVNSKGENIIIPQVSDLTIRVIPSN